MIIHIWSSWQHWHFTVPHEHTVAAKGNEGLAALVILAHTSRAGPSQPRSGGIAPRSSVGQDGSPEYSRKHYDMLQQITCMILRLPSSPWPLKDTYHYHLGWRRVLGGYPDCSSSSLHARFFPVRANDGVWPDYVRLLNSYQLNEFASCFYILFLPLVWDNVVNRKNTEKYTEQIHHARVFGL